MTKFEFKENVSTITELKNKVKTVTVFDNNKKVKYSSTINMETGEVSRTVTPIHYVKYQKEEEQA